MQDKETTQEDCFYFLRSRGCGVPSKLVGKFCCVPERIGAVSALLRWNAAPIQHLLRAGYLGRRLRPSTAKLCTALPKQQSFDKGPSPC